MPDRPGWIQPFGTYAHAIHDSSAAENAERVLEFSKPLRLCSVSGVCQKTISLQKPSWADELVGIPPKRRTRRRAAPTEDALIEAVELFTVFWALKSLLLRGLFIVNQIGLYLLVLLEEVAHIND